MSTSADRSLAATLRLAAVQQAMITMAAGVSQTASGGAKGTVTKGGRCIARFHTEKAQRRATDTEPPRPLSIVCFSAEPDVKLDAADLAALLHIATAESSKHHAGAEL